MRRIRKKERKNGNEKEETVRYLLFNILQVEENATINQNTEVIRILDR
jgi:hypothetical protein